MRDNEAESLGPLARFADQYPFNFINVASFISRCRTRAPIMAAARDYSPVYRFSRAFFATWRSAATSASRAAVSARTMR
ncbi:hypothetical protein OKW27_007442 [Paraburkholderia sp. 35.1]